MLFFCWYHFPPVVEFKSLWELYVALVGLMVVVAVGVVVSVVVVVVVVYKGAVGVWLKKRTLFGSDGSHAKLVM